MKTKWKCFKCNIVTTFERTADDKYFKCQRCGNRVLFPVSEEKLPSVQLYRMCWQHAEFPTSSEGPPLIHLNRHTGKKEKSFTKDEAIRRCNLYNLKHNKDNKVRHWIERV